MAWTIGISMVASGDVIVMLDASLTRVSKVALEQFARGGFVGSDGWKAAVEQRTGVAHQPGDVGDQLPGIMMIGDTAVDQFHDVVGQLVGSGVADGVPADGGEC